MIQLIDQGKYSMRNDKWARVSSSAKEFVQKLLEMDQYKRLTADQALKHPWIKSKMVGVSSNKVKERERRKGRSPTDGVHYYRIISKSLGVEGLFRNEVFVTNRSAPREIAFLLTSCRYETIRYRFFRNGSFSTVCPYGSRLRFF